MNAAHGPWHLPTKENISVAVQVYYAEGSNRCTVDIIAGGELRNQHMIIGQASERDSVVKCVVEWCVPFCVQKT